MLPPIIPQQSVQKIRDNHTFIILCFGCCFLPPAIAALIVGSQYDEGQTKCHDKEHPVYLIDLNTYLYVAGGVQFAFLIYVFSFLFKKRRRGFIVWCERLMCGVGLFNFAWAVVGAIIVGSEMSVVCRNETIGIMIIAWVVIQLTFGFPIGCCTIFTICCSMCMVGLTVIGPGPSGGRHAIQQRQDDDEKKENDNKDADEQDPLLKGTIV